MFIPKIQFMELEEIVGFYRDLTFFGLKSCYPILVALNFYVFLIIHVG